MVILAAGKGTRMRSELPKALHPICGRPMLAYLLDAAESIGVQKIIVVGGYQIDLLKEFLGQFPPLKRRRTQASLVRQKKQLGSGHAVDVTRKYLRGFDGSVMVLYCDTPLLSAETLKALLDRHLQKGAMPARPAGWNRVPTAATPQSFDVAAPSNDGAILTVESDDPSGYGRVVRNPDGTLEKIIEENDALPDEKSIHEINVGAYVFDSKKLFGALRRVHKNKKKNEFYLTDAVGILAQAGRVECVKIGNKDEVLGVNTRCDLAMLDEIMQKRILDGWMERGVTIKSPQNTTIDADVRIGQDTVILPGTVIEEGSVIGRKCVLGPFARIRGKSVIEDESVIGNFVEIVRSRVGKRTMIKHLSYIGDAEIGSGVNVGAGSITANYDGKQKHKTVIGDGAQIGSGTILVAPVTIGKNAKTGAGAVVTKNTRVKAGATFVGVPAKEMRLRQR